MMNKEFTHIVFCNFCGNKSLVHENDIFMNPRTEVQKRLRRITESEEDYQNNSKNVQLPRLVKCKKCGRGVVIQKLPKVYKDTIQKIEQKNSIEEREKERLQRIKDGQPYTRNVDDDFIG